MYDLYHLALVTWDPTEVKPLSKHNIINPSRWPVNNQWFHWEISDVGIVVLNSFLFLSLSGSLMASVFLNWCCFGHCVFMPPAWFWCSALPCVCLLLSWWLYLLPPVPPFNLPPSHYILAALSFSAVPDCQMCYVHDQKSSPRLHVSLSVSFCSAFALCFSHVIPCILNVSDPGLGSHSMCKSFCYVIPNGFCCVTFIWASCIWAQLFLFWVDSHLYS